MSWAVWQREGNTPPEPDDSYSYITGITLIARYGTPLPPLPGIPRVQAIDLGVDHLTYNLALGLTSRLTGVGPETVYHASFYVGKAALLGALLFFLARSRLRREEQAATLAVLAAYAGDPATHGFYWVAPSFWLLVLFLVMAGLLAGEGARSPAALAGGFAMGLISIGVHPLSAWVVPVLALFTALSLWRSGRWRGVRYRRWEVLAGAGVGLLAMAVVSMWFGMSSPAAPPPQALATPSAALPGLIAPIAPEGGLWQRIGPTLPSAWLIWTTYVRFLIAQPYIIVVGWAFLVLWRRRQGDSHFLWLAALLGVLGVAVHPSGYRTVLFAWPLTYPLLAVGILDVMGRLRGRFPRAGPAIATATLGLTLAASAATFVYYRPAVLSLARSVDFTWDQRCAADLLTMSDARSIVEYSDKYVLGALMAHGLLERRWGTVREHLAEPGGKYFFAWSPQAVIPREQVEALLGRPLRVARRCGYFTIYAVDEG